MNSTALLNLACINIAAMVIMIVITCCSHGINVRKKIYFSLVFSAIILVICFQTLTYFLIGNGPGLRWLQVIAIYIGFLLTPLIPILFAGAISDYQRSKTMLILFGAYALILLLAIPQNLVYAVDAGNHYSRGRFYWLCLLIYGIAIVHLVRETTRLCIQYQNSNRTTMILLLLFLIVGTSIQVLLPYAYMTWASLCFSSILFYIYCNDLCQQVDGLTGLLNHGTYLHRMEDLPDGVTLILFDVDRFKEVNDTYGHLFGDRCLCQAASLIRTVYGPIGFCYRIGGDEFAVITRKKKFNALEKQNKFTHFLRELCKATAGMPSVSVGSAVYHKGMTIQQLINEADRNMYQQKKSSR